MAGFHRRRAAPMPTASWTGLALVGFLCSLAVSARPHLPSLAAGPARGVETVQHADYPELRVDGRPFFPNSAAFFYSRIPRYLWESSLEQYLALGINTIDLYIIWNWHEPREGELDFDGHTNPRRDLRGLLELIARKGFKLIARPGPTILNEWRNGGYPDWLLAQAPYGMPLADRLEGRYPPPAERNARDAESAARMWLQNPVHMTHARAWLEAVARELAPYRASTTLRVPADVPRKPKETQEKTEISGPLLFVQIEDDLAIGRANDPGSEFWKYAQTLCGFLRQGGVDAPCFINPTQPRAAAGGSALFPPIFTMGQWYLPPDGSVGLDERRISPADVAGLELEVALDATQPAFPPILVEFDAGWYAPGDDARPQPSPASNVLLSAGLLLGGGIRGFNWFPLQDTLTPAGFETPWTNRYYRWDAALSLSGSHRGRYPAIERIGQQLRAWGSLLAASHRRADFAVVDPLPALPWEKLSRENAQEIAGTTERLVRLADYAGLAADLVDPKHQPSQQLLRYPLLLFPVFRPEEMAYELSEAAQQTLAAYVRAGGTLICFPGPPTGRAFLEMRQSPPAPPGALPQGTSVWQAGSGRLAVLTKDFYSWVSPSADFSDGRSRLEAPYSIALLENLLTFADLRAVVRRSPETPPNADFIASELVSNEGTQPLGERSGGQGWLSVSNLSYDTPLAQTLEVLSPRSSARPRNQNDPGVLSIPVNVPPAESLLLPLEMPLCMAAEPGRHCEDRIVLSGAELVRAERDGKAMLLTFCVPGRATVLLHLSDKPGHAEMDENPAPTKWTPEQKELSVDLLRGASPGFLRVLRVPLPYTPALPERPSSEKRRPAPMPLHISGLGGVHLPLGEDSTLLPDPPLFVLEKGADATLRVGADNPNDSGNEVQVRLSGAFDASGHAYVPGGMLGVVKLVIHSSAIQAVAASPPGEDGLYRGFLHTIPAGPADNSLVYLAIVPERGAAGYTFDFDGDGQPELVLENTALRAIVSPASGGRLIALVEKGSDVTLASTAGLFEDAFAFTPNPARVRPERARGRYGTFNRLYASNWVPEEGGPALHLSYDAPDVYPHGARIEKTYHLTGERTGAVEYRVSLLQADEHRLSEEAAGRVLAGPLPEGLAQSFVILGSVPAFPGVERGSHFCWTPSSDQASTAAGAEEHCDGFLPGGPAISPPAGVTRMEIRQAHRPTLSLDWSGAGAAARVALEPKRYTVLLRLTCPTLDPGGAPGVYRIEFSVKEAP